MALYLGKSKVKINLDGTIYSVNMYSTSLPITTDILLASSNDLLFQDINGIYLALKINSRLRSSDNYVLKDSNGIYITHKEEK